MSGLGVTGNKKIRFVRKMKWILAGAMLAVLFSIAVTAPIQTRAAQKETSSAAGVNGGTLKEALGDLDSGEMKEIIAFIKEKSDNGMLETEEDIREAIKEGEERFQVKLTKSQVEELITAVEKLKGFGLSSEDIVNQAEKLYDKYGAQIVDQTDEAITEAVNEAVAQVAAGFWEEMKNSVTGFFKNIFDF